MLLGPRRHPHAALIDQPDAQAKSCCSDRVRIAVRPPITRRVARSPASFSAVPRQTPGPHKKLTGLLHRVSREGRPEPEVAPKSLQDCQAPKRPIQEDMGLPSADGNSGMTGSQPQRLRYHLAQALRGHPLADT